MSEKQDYTQEQLTKLSEAYASGVLEFRFGNEKTAYRSAQEMLETVRMIERSLALSRLRKMNESKLSQRLGLSVCQLKKIKRGKAPPDFRILAELAEVLDCPVTSLLELRIRDDFRRCGMNLDVRVREAA